MKNRSNVYEEAAVSILHGGRAAPPYNHEVTMKKYREEHKKNFNL